VTNPSSITDLPAPDPSTPRLRWTARLFRSLRPSPTGHRLAIAFGVIAAAAVCYGIILARLGLLEQPQERMFGAANANAAIEVYVEPINIDPTNDAMQLRLSISGGRAAARGPAMLPSRDLLLTVAHEQTTEQVDIRANQLVPAASFEIDLNDGSVNDYPVDRYTATMRLQCLEKSAADRADTAVLLPARVTAWEGALGFSVHATELPAQKPGEVVLRFSVERKSAFIFFAFAAYAAMVILALGALTVGVLVFAGHRKIEATLMGALGAAIFALPALRNALPGSPPLGVHADLLTFLWAEMAAVIAFALFVAGWAHRGPRP
jgi:hypothetical protein